MALVCYVHDGQVFIKTFKEVTRPLHSSEITTKYLALHQSIHNAITCFYCIIYVYIYLGDTTTNNNRLIASRFLRDFHF